MDHAERPERSLVPYRGQPTKDNGTENSRMYLTWPNRKDSEITNKGKLSTQVKGFDLGISGAGRSQKRRLWSLTNVLHLKIRGAKV